MANFSTAAADQFAPYYDKDAVTLNKRLYSSAYANVNASRHAVERRVS